jgi:hypothetical protein
MVRSVAVVGLGVCGSTMFSDPAVRLTRCIWEAAARVDASGGEVVATCEPRSPAPFTVVIHPAEDRPDSELVTAGLDPMLVDTVHLLRSYGGGDGVYVLPNARGRPSFTGIGWRQAVVPNVLVVSKPAHASVEVVVRDGAYGPAVIGLR